MKIKLTRNTFVIGQSRSVGDVVEVPRAIGQRLLLMQKAVEIESQAEAQPAEVQLPDVAPEAIEPLIDTTLVTSELLKPKRKKAK